MSAPSSMANRPVASTGSADALTPHGGIGMNSDTMEGNWKQLKGKMREKWGKLTDDDWDTVAGKKDQLVGKLQERYGYSREQAEKDYSDWEKANERSSNVA